MTEDRELISVFLEEAQERLDQMASTLRQLEQNPTDAMGQRQLLQQLHMIKGTSGTVGMANLERTAHRAESLVEAMATVDARAPQYVGPIAEAVDSMTATVGAAHRALHRHEPKPNAVAMPQQGPQSRLATLGEHWRRLGILVEDLALADGKQAILDIRGQDIQVDSSLARRLHAPLLQLIRNAVFHGIEQPSVRESLGKSPCGVVVLHAYVCDQNLVVTVTDDGCGLPTAAIAARALAQGLVTADDLADLGPIERARLAFGPGVTTRNEATLVAGRGVGLDAVRAFVEQLGGEVDLWTREGQGTTVSMWLPRCLYRSPATASNMPRDGGPS
ncbi:MAG: ATP-binding protein [Myxococcota bacterium]